MILFPINKMQINKKIFILLKSEAEFTITIFANNYFSSQEN